MNATTNPQRDASDTPTKDRPRWRQVSTPLRVVAWVSFVLNVLIIATGGTVRLTGSGLGCTDWPVCTPGEFIPVPEMGIHGVIEFANRTITGPLLLAALAVVVLTLLLRPWRRDLLTLAVVTLVGIIAQALIGAFVVWLQLNANLVGVHYALSLILVAVTAAYLVRMHGGPSREQLQVPGGFLSLAWATVVTYAFSVYFGILTTGAGPHSGDEDILRKGVDATLLSHIHAWPGYLTVALVLALTVWSFSAKLASRKWLLALLLALVFQAAVGVYQARNGLPVLAVGIHMVFAALTGAGLTVAMMRMRRSTASMGSAPSR